MWPNPQETADLVIFTEEILNGKLRLLFSVLIKYDYDFTHLFKIHLPLLHLNSHIDGVGQFALSSSSPSTQSSSPSQRNFGSIQNPLGHSYSKGLVQEWRHLI